jgi:hypothetical protein
VERLVPRLRGLLLSQHDAMAVGDAPALGQAAGQAGDNNQDQAAQRQRHQLQRLARRPAVVWADPRQQIRADIGGCGQQAKEQPAQRPRPDRHADQRQQIERVEQVVCVLAEKRQ